MIQICRVDGPILSKGAGLPFAEVVAVPVIITPVPVDAGLLAGQELVS
jgi:hypothetical protein